MAQLSVAPAAWLLLADLVPALHVAFVAFVVLGLGLAAAVSRFNRSRSTARR